MLTKISNGKRMIPAKPRVDKMNFSFVYLPNNSIMACFLFGKPVTNNDFAPRQKFLDFTNRAVSSYDITKLKLLAQSRKLIIFSTDALIGMH